MMNLSVFSEMKGGGGPCLPNYFFIISILFGFVIEIFDAFIENYSSLYWKVGKQVSNAFFVANMCYIVLFKFGVFYFFYILESIANGTYDFV